MRPSGGDGGRVVPPAAEEAIHDYLMHDRHPIFDAWARDLRPPTRRQRLRMRWWDLRHALADRVGGGRHYTDGCDG